MLEDKEAKKIEAPQYKDLRDLAQHALLRRKELLNELQFIEVTLRMVSKKISINIDLDNNTMEDKP